MNDCQFEIGDKFTCEEVGKCEIVDILISLHTGQVVIELMDESNAREFFFKQEEITIVEEK